jgi:protein-tyrosine phosphatase
MIRVCFVCLGNICRSPQAEGIFRRMVTEAGLQDIVHVDSAGTSAYHEGELADPRTRAASRRHGLELTGRSRPFSVRDLDEFDYVLAMDSSVLSALQRMARTPAQRQRLHLLLALDPTSATNDVPDPYSSGPDGFELVYQLCHSGCDHLLARVKLDLADLESSKKR